MTTIIYPQPHHPIPSFIYWMVDIALVIILWSIALFVFSWVILYLVERRGQLLSNNTEKR